MDQEENGALRQLSDSGSPFYLFAVMNYPEDPLNTTMLASSGFKNGQGDESTPSVAPFSPGSSSSSRSSDHEREIKQFLSSRASAERAELMSSARIEGKHALSFRDKAVETDAFLGGAPLSSFSNAGRRDVVPSCLPGSETPAAAETPHSEALGIHLPQFDHDDEEEWVERRRKFRKRKLGVAEWLWWFLGHSRTERAFRMVICFIPALLVSYNKWLGPNLAYSCALLYVLMSALLPPMVSGVSIASFMAFPAGVVGTSIVTAVWAVGTISWGLSPDWSMFLLATAFVTLVSPWKAGKLTALTGMAALMAVYSAELPFFIGVPFVQKGFSLSVPTHELQEALEKYLPPIPPAIIPPVIKAIIDAIKSAIEAGEVFHYRFPIPQLLADFESDFQPLVGRLIDLSISREICHFHLDGGLWVVQLAWTGRGKLGLIRAILEYGSIALGLFMASVLLPPQRYARSYLRQRVCAATREAGTLLQLIGESAALYTAQQLDAGVVCIREIEQPKNELPGAVMFSVVSMGDHDPARHYRARVDSESSMIELAGSAESPGRTTRRRKGENVSYFGFRTASLRGPSFTTAPTPDRDTSLLSYHPPRAMSEVFPSLDEAAEATERFLDYNQPSWNFEAAQMEDTLRQAILSISELTPLVGVSAFEPSLSNPGPAISYFLRWPPVLDSLRRVFVHQRSFWVLVNLSQQATPGDLWPNLPQQSPVAASSNLEIVRKLFSVAKRVTTLSVDTYHLAADTVGMKPVSRGSQVETVKRLKDQMRRNVHDLVGLRERLTKDLKPFESLDTSPALRDWRTAVCSHATFLEFTQVTVESPLQLAVAVDRLINDQTLRRVPKGILLTVVGFIMPLLAILASLIKGAVHLIMPWTWRWRVVHPKYAGTGLPWYRSTDVLYCYRWVIGILGLFALPIFSEAYRTWYFTQNPHEEGIISYLDTKMTSKMPSWTSLGYLCTMFLTVEGTVHRAALRILGVFLGTGCAYLCLVIFGTANVAAHIVWLCVTVFIAVWIGGNPTSAILGYHPSWGYAAQLFTYQETIIIVESYFKIESRDELVVSRLLAQVIGISTAVLVSFLICPNRSDATIRQCSVQVLYCTKQSLISLVESLLVVGDIDEEATNKETVSVPHHMEKPLPRKHNLQRCASRFGRKTVTHGSKWNENQFEFERNQKRERLKKRALDYHADAKAAFDKIADHMKDLAIFKEMAIFRLDKSLQESLVCLQLLFFHMEAFEDLETIDHLPSVGTVCREEFLHLLKALSDLGNCLEDAVAQDVNQFYPGYTMYSRFFIQLFCPRRHRKAEERRRRTIQETIRRHTLAVNAAFDAVGAKYGAVLALSRKLAAQKEPEEDPSQYDSVSGMPLSLWVWLTTMHFLLTYARGLRNYMMVLFATDPTTPVASKPAPEATSTS